MDLVDGEIAPVTVADGTGLYASQRVQLHVRYRCRCVMAGRTGRGDREGFNGLQDGFPRIDMMMLGRLHIRSQNASARDQQFGTIASRGDVTLLTVAKVSRKAEILH